MKRKRPEQLRFDFANFRPTLDDSTFASRVASIIGDVARKPRKGPRRRPIPVTAHTRWIKDMRKKGNAS